ncbi:hypothetical protein Vretifemale_15885 [Volvox reticuliferus]|nr:hypothetical protein Vretifemale_15885 [Volvox reticuliferus]
MPLKLPDFLKRMVGLDSVAVSEVQRVVWHGGGAFTVMSETNITNMLGAGRFTTALQLTVTEPQQPSPAASTGEGSHEGQAAESRGAGGDSASAMVQVVYSVRCATGSIPWPMSATIENVMSEKALVSMQSFLDFCTQLLEEQAAVSAAAAVAAAKLGGAVAPTVASGDAAITPAAAAALLEPVARVSDTGTTSVAAAAGAAAQLQSRAAPLPPLLSPFNRRWALHLHPGPASSATWRRIQPRTWDPSALASPHESSSRRLPPRRTALQVAHGAVAQPERPHSTPVIRSGTAGHLSPAPRTWATWGWPASASVSPVGICSSYNEQTPWGQQGAVMYFGTHPKTSRPSAACRVLAVAPSARAISYSSQTACVASRAIRARPRWLPAVSAPRLLRL